MLVQPEVPTLAARWLRAAAGLALLALLASACSTRADGHPAATSPLPKGPGVAATSGAPATAATAPSAAKGSAPTKMSGKGQYSDPNKPLPANQLPFTPDPSVPIDATVTPACVPAGGVATLTVHTDPKAVIAFQAIYSDGHAGTKPPYGAGYGGNDAGRARGGTYVGKWTVSANAPTGKGRIDVFAATGSAQNYAAIPWTVGAAGTC